LLDIDKDGSFFFDDAAVALARDLLARLAVAFCEREEDWTLASSLEAFEEEDTTDLESVQTEVDDDDAPTAADLTVEAAEDFTDDLPPLSLRFRSLLSAFIYERPGGSD